MVYYLRVFFQMVQVQFPASTWGAHKPSVTLGQEEFNALFWSL